MAVVAPEEALTVTGWVPVDDRRSYFRHEARFGPAIFDRFEVGELESGRRRPPPRARAYRCRLPSGRIEEGVCWKLRAAGSLTRSRKACGRAEAG
jgi:hypothetical protein